MNELINLARIVTERRLKVLPLLDFTARHAANKEMALVQLITTEQNRTQQQLIKALYGNLSSASHTAFRKLKSRVQQKLLNHLFFLDDTDPRHPVGRRYEQQFMSLYFQVNTLFAEGDLHTAEPLARKALRLARTYELTQYAVSCGQMLRALYADLRLPARYRANNVELARNQRVLELEESAAQVYWEVKASMAYTVQACRAVLNKIDFYVEQLRKFHREANSYATLLYYYRTRLYKEELVGNYEEIIRITTVTAKQLAQEKINKLRFDKRYNSYYLVYAHFRIRQASKGLKLAEEYAKDFHPSSVHWPYFMEIYLLLAVHAGQYGQAQELLHMVRKNVHFQKQAVVARQRWDLYEVYLQFIRPEASPLRMRNFTTFIQTVPDHSRDKQGYNVAVLILQFLYYLRQRDLDGLLTRLESLRKYQQRHLREAGALRSQLFFRMLALTVKSEFDPKASRHSAEALLHRLQAAPPPGEAFSEIEIIPYENLWGLTLDILEENARKESTEAKQLV